MSNLMSSYNSSSNCHLAAQPEKAFKQNTSRYSNNLEGNYLEENDIDRLIRNGSIDLHGVSNKKIKQDILNKYCHISNRKSKKISVNCRYADLSNMDMSNLDLSFCDFTNANLRGANFHGSELYCTKFFNADLYKVNFREANLTESNLLNSFNLQTANLYKTDFTKADIGYFNAEGVSLNYTKFSYVDLTNVQNLDKASLDYACFYKAKFPVVNFSGKKLVGIVLADSNIEMIEFDNANLTLAQLDNVNFDGKNIKNVNFSFARLVGANFSGAINVNKADLTQADISHANFSGINLSNSNIYHVKEFYGSDFKGADLRQTKVKAKDVRISYMNPVVDQTTKFSGFFW